MSSSNQKIANECGYVMSGEAYSIVHSVLEFLESDNIIFSSSCPKTPILAMLHTIEKKSQGANCTIEYFKDGIEISRTRSQFMLSDSEMVVDFSGIEDETFGMPNYKKRVVYKGKYSATFKMPMSVAQNNADVKDYESKLRVDWYIDNFVVHLDFITYEDGKDGKKYYFLPNDNDPEHYEVYAKIGYNDYEFAGTISFLSIYRAFLSLFKILPHVNIQKEANAPLLEKSDSVKRLYRRLREKLEDADKPLATF